MYPNSKGYGAAINCGSSKASVLSFSPLYALILPVLSRKLVAVGLSNTKLNSHTPGVAVHTANFKYSPLVVHSVTQAFPVCH